MANIFQKIKRKRRRKKIQAQKARAEQEQQSKNSRNNNDDDYMTKLSRHKHAELRKGLMTAVVVIAAAAAVIIYIEKRSYHNYKVIQTSEQEDVVSTKYEEMDGKILRYSPDGASLVNGKMESYWSALYEMQNPVADVKGLSLIHI